jgi:hypothetical protein
MLAKCDCIPDSAFTAYPGNVTLPDLSHFLSIGNQAFFKATGTLLLGSSAKYSPINGTLNRQPRRLAYIGIGAFGSAGAPDSHLELQNMHKLEVIEMSVRCSFLPIVVNKKL